MPRIAVKEIEEAGGHAIAVGADLIAGFPTEDAAMAARSLALIDDCRIVHAHIFAFSPRAGTPAARMPQLDRRLVAARAAALRERAGAARRPAASAPTTTPTAKATPAIAWAANLVELSSATKLTAGVARMRPAKSVLT